MTSLFSNAEVDWALSFTPWEEWLGMRIDPHTLDEFTAPAIIFYCLWDITFHGFTQETIREFIDELEQECDKIDAMTEEEREEYLIPVEEVFRKLRERTEPD